MHRMSELGLMEATQVADTALNGLPSGDHGPDWHGRGSVDQYWGSLRNGETAREDQALGAVGRLFSAGRNHRTRVDELGSRVVAAMALEALWGPATSARPAHV
jgi:hypothetical protein